MLSDPTAGGGTEGLRDSLAVWLMACDECIGGDRPADYLEHERRFLAHGRDAEHSGDCTKESHACSRCICDMYLRNADALIAGPLTDFLARASAERARVEAERDEREAWATAWHRVVETTLILMDLSPALGGDEAASAIQAKLASLTAERDRLRAAMALAAGRLDVAAGRMTWGITAFGVREWAKEARAALREPHPTPEAPDV